ncbi:MAG: 5'/3'-nucleotidase SurE [Bacillota bacterium]
MKILLVNDDGYSAEGLVALATTLIEAGHTVNVVAPENGCSGDSHAVTFYKPIKVRKVTEYKWGCYAIEGHPADCTKIALRHFFVDDLPDLVLSGINNLPNVGDDIMYSGTANAAAEASNDGLPAIALSGSAESHEDFAYFCALFMANFDYFVSLTNKNSALNVNFSDDRSGALRPKITQMGVHKYYDYYVVDDKDNPTVAKIEGYPVDAVTPADSDVVWFKKGYTTITPLALNRTDFARLDVLKKEIKNV